MKKETIRTYIDEDIYISDDGLKKSKSKLDIVEYEQNLQIGRNIQEFIAGALDEKTLSILDDLDITCGWSYPEVYKVRNYEELAFVVGELSKKYNASPYKPHIEVYKNTDFNKALFIFSRYDNADARDDLNIYELSEIKGELNQKIIDANRVMADIERIAK